MKLAQHIFSLKIASVVLIALFFLALPSQETFAQTAKDGVYLEVDEMPIPPGGIEGWNSYLGKNMTYPIAAREAKVEGKVIITFVVLENGETSNIEILKGIGKGCDEEVMRLVKESPKWTPGKKDGEKVKTRMTLPVNFKL
ncbi:energy transducer TonB [Algoriphagus sp.]|uniref:energy transducer TonB n=1 Tax=Algoriphagus sp. TaxID=1872435 RepID=UPI00326C632D